MSTEKINDHRAVGMAIYNVAVSSPHLRFVLKTDPSTAGGRTKRIRKSDLRSFV